MIGGGLPLGERKTRDVLSDVMEKIEEMVKLNIEQYLDAGKIALKLVDRLDDDDSSGTKQPRVKPCSIAAILAEGLSLALKIEVRIEPQLTNEKVEIEGVEDFKTGLEPREAEKKEHHRKVEKRRKEEESIEKDIAVHKDMSGDLIRNEEPQDRGLLSQMENNKGKQHKVVPVMSEPNIVERKPEILTDGWSWRFEDSEYGKNLKVKDPKLYKQILDRRKWYVDKDGKVVPKNSESSVVQNSWTRVS
ncbi:hypothetical protein GE061_016802 [Apolygus lucorum]|uniref:Uncharacterized protein n=1 Tax=Apolygus lucorum TaxID=248454 RepID=A0A8S9XJB5_APOLU|nr:hypothetical protein GE061_016802 [Apolygus lucorum]